MSETNSAFQRHLHSLQQEDDPSNLYWPLTRVAAAASACKLWLEGEGLEPTGANILAMAGLVLNERAIDARTPHTDDVTLAVQAGAPGFEWYAPAGRPDLTPEKAMPIAIATGTAQIGNALEAVASALLTIAERMPEE